MASFDVTKWVWLKLKELGLRRFESLVSICQGCHFDFRVFEPQPNRPEGETLTLGLGGKRNAVLGAMNTTAETCCTTKPPMGQKIGLVSLLPLDSLNQGATCQLWCQGLWSKLR